MAETNNAKIKIGEINQVGLIVKDIEKTVKDYWNIFGLGPHIIVTVEPVDGYAMTYRGKAAKYKFKASFCRVGATELELIESIEGPSIYEDYLKKHGEGANHVQSLAKSVKEVDRNIEIMSVKGFPLLMGGQYGSEIAFAYIDTVSALKTIWETVKMPDVPSGIPVIYPSSDQKEGSAKVKVKAINRIGIVVLDLEKVKENYQNILGISPWDMMELSFPKLHDVTYMGRAVNPRWKTATATAGPVQLELIQPISGKNIYADFLDKNGEGIHHIQFLVDDIEKTNRIMEQEGFPVLMGGEYQEGRFAYYDTLGPLKVIWKALQAPKVAP